MRYKIYVGHSRDIRFDYLNALYLPLTNALGVNELILPHPAAQESQINSEKVIPTCDFMIAEVSYPSTGLGMELAWARAANIPVLCICSSSCTPSSSVTNFFSHIYAYVSPSDMVEQVSQWMVHKLQHY